MGGGLPYTTFIEVEDLPEQMCDACGFWAFRKRSCYRINDDGVSLVWSETYCGHCRLDAQE